MKIDSTRLEEETTSDSHYKAVGIIAGTSFWVEA